MQRARKVSGLQLSSLQTRRSVNKSATDYKFLLLTFGITKYYNRSVCACPLQSLIGCFYSVYSGLVPGSSLQLAFFLRRAERICRWGSRMGMALEYKSPALQCRFERSQANSYKQASTRKFQHSEPILSEFPPTVSLTHVNMRKLHARATLELHPFVIISTQRAEKMCSLFPSLAVVIVHGKDQARTAATSWKPPGPYPTNLCLSFLWANDRVVGSAKLVR